MTMFKRNSVLVSAACAVGILIQPISWAEPVLPEAEGLQPIPSTVQLKEDAIPAAPLQTEGVSAVTQDVSQSEAMRTVVIPADTILNVQLAETLHSKDNKLGDAVTATVTSPVYIGPMLAVPEGSVITGRITDINGEPQKDGPNPYIVVDFHQLQRPNETRNVPFNGTLIAYKTGFRKGDYVWKIPHRGSKVRAGLVESLKGAALGFSADPDFGPPVGAGVGLLKFLVVDKVAKGGAFKVKPDKEIPISVQQDFRMPVVSGH